MNLYAFTSRIVNLGLCPFLSFMIFFLVKAYRPIGGADDQMVFLVLFE